MTETTQPLTLQAPGSAANVRRRLTDLRRERPEWEQWFELFQIVLDAGGDPSWERAAEATVLRPDRAPGAPLLQGAVTPLPIAPVDDFLRRLLTTAGAVHELSDPGAMLSAAINQEPAADPTLEVVAQLACMPVLQALNRRYGAAAAAGWIEGYCPMCGAWPALVEQRGLERERRLRCGRCGCDWCATAHRCVLCGETDHDKLGALLTGETSDGSRIETCETCRGYVKVIAALRPSTTEELPLNDLATVELDLAALHRGFARADTRAISLDLTVVMSDGSGT
jgi:FdhE protein